MSKRKVTPLILNEAEIAQAAPALANIIEMVATTYRQEGEGRVEVPTKIGVHPTFEKSFLHAMPAWVPDQKALGMKWISYFPGSQKNDIPDSTGIIILNDPDIGLPVAIMEGMWITYARTTASAIVMARHLLAKPPEVVALIGCGGLGQWSLLMLREVFPDIREVRVASRNSDTRQKFCTEMSAAMPYPVVSCETVQEAVEAADMILSSIAPPPSPFIQAEWLKDDVLAVAMDYFHCYTPGAISSFSSIISDNVPYIATYLQKQTDVKSNADTLFFQKLLADKTAPLAAGRRLAIPTGIASIDMTLAWEIYRKAQDLGLGVKIALTN